jgi:hypothetical protein
MKQDLKGKTICLDFDGVIHSYRRGWTGFVPEDPPEPGAREFVQTLMNREAKVVVCSARCGVEKGCEATVAWLEKHGFPPVKVSHGKPIADYYVDDRAVKYDGDWGEVAAQIERTSKKT